MNEKGKRFGLLRIAQGLLRDPDADHTAQLRTVYCYRTMTGQSVSVYRQVEGSGARLSGITTCGSVWVCPVCAAKIAEQRRHELSQALARWILRGGHGYLLTLTFPHESEHALEQLLEQQGKALQRFKNSRTYKRIMEKAGRIGSVRSLEVTVGLEHGWHPHTHDLIFAQKDAFSEADIDALKNEWIKSLEKVGLAEKSQRNDLWENALDLRSGEYAAEYIAKYGRDSRWGASSEMTQGHKKLGARGKIDGSMHFTPFQLLAWADSGDAWAAAKFIEYGKIINGKRMLSWSPGLKSELGILDKTDEELAAEEAGKPEEEHIGSLSEDQYSVVLSRNALGELLAYAAAFCTAETGQEDLDEFVEALKKRKPSHRGNLRIRGGMSHRLMEIYN
jgi:hypothetical protein